ncbi:MAG: hypothetical protein COB24_14670 [Hyphomicrobiales bacterium]|nr:MAG: hypothetical protein COB24_14670 [Hyphomicrobiales bacterium]
MTKVKNEPAAHSQVVERTCRILREIVWHGPVGARLVDLTRATGLSRPTVHRLLRSLVVEKFVHQNENRRYCLGSSLFEISLAAPNPFADLTEFRHIIQELADTCGDTVYFAIRRGDQAFYLLRCEGVYPIRTHVVTAGQSLSLVGSHCGSVLLAALEESEIEGILERAERHPEFFGAGTIDSLRTQIDETNKMGFNWASDVAVKEVAGIAAPVPNPNGRPYLAVSISAISSRLDKKRALKLSKLLLKATKKISELID